MPKYYKINLKIVLSVLNTKLINKFTIIGHNKINKLYKIPKYVVYKLS